MLKKDNPLVATLITVMVAVLLVGSSTVLLARDAVASPILQEGNEPTATELPTDEPPATELPTDEPTATELPTETQSPTDEVTSEPTATGTPVETESPTPDGLPDEPALALLFGDTFESGDLSAWTLSDGWALTVIDSNNVLVATNSPDTLLLNQDALSNIVVETRFQATNTTFVLGARQSAAGNYTVTIAPNGLIQLIRAGVVLDFAQTAPLVTNEWATLRLSVIDGIIRVAVNGNEEIAVHDDAPLPLGSLTFAAAFSPDTETQDNTLLLDDVLVWVPVDELEIALDETLPPPTEVGEAELTLTETPEAEVALAVTGPAAPTLIAPVNKLLTTDNTPDMIWSSVVNAVEYEIQIATNKQFDNIVQTTIVVITTYVPTTLNDGRYFWRVRSLDNSGTPSNWSAKRRFTVDTIAPDIPILNLPLNGDTMESNRAQFRWNKNGDVSTYEIRLDTFNPPVNTFTSRRNRFRARGLLIRIYYWQVRAIDKAGNASAWTSIRSVDIISASRDRVIPNRFTTATPILSWGEVTWAMEYEIQVDSSTRFRNPVQTHTATAGTHTTTLDPLPNGFWYWRVRARQADDRWGRWSRPAIFAVDV